MSDSGKSILCYRGNNDKIYYVASSNDPNVGPGGGMIEVTWQELKNKRDAGELIPGCLYRITDYQCTTTQENTKSAGHQFDIVLLALSENKLAEEGWAMMHDNIYDVTFADGVTKKCYLYEDPTDEGFYYAVDVDTLLGQSSTLELDVDIQIDEENKIATSSTYSSTYFIEENVPYNYFQNSNLSAWKIWYCLDNDKSKFAWADDSVDEGSPASITDKDNTILYRNSAKDTTVYAWTSESNRTLYTESETPNIGDNLLDVLGQHSDKYGTVISYTPAHEGTGLPNGRGVIYRLIDEFNNDIKYDFKNIQFKRTITNGQYDANGTETWCYTLNVWYNNMCQDASIVGNTLPNDEGYINGVYDNRFGYATAYDAHIGGTDTFAYVLGDNVVLSIDEGEYYGIYSNTIGDSFFSNTIGTEFYHNTIGNGFYKNMISSLFYDNTIGNLFNYNTVGNNFAGNMIGYNFQSNTIGNRFNNNMIGNNFVNKTISDNTYYKNYGSNGVELATK